MSLLDAQHQRLLEALRETGGQPVTFSKLHAAGVTFPATVISELEMSGYVIKRVHQHGRPVGVRLVGTQPPTSPHTSSPAEVEPHP